MSPPLLVSACLVGFRCRYDGKDKLDLNVLRRLEGHSWLAVCPEQWAGLSTPRDPIMFEGGTGRDIQEGRARIVRVDGTDVTEELIEASRSIIRMAKLYGVRTGILKERSPSCGVRRTYRGDDLVEGMGIFAAMLQREGVEIFSEETLGLWKAGHYL